MTAKIGICLATFNGARFLQQQLDSIAAQSFTDWHLYARDDGSIDGTPEILADFAFRYPARVTILRDDLGRLGAKANFAHLMGVTTEPYVAFSDQDDVWRPEKLALSLAEMRTVERRRAQGVPAMVHGDRAVVNGRGREIAASYWRSRHVHPADLEPEACFAFPLAAGAAMVINRPLADMALPMPPEARMHDCWIELLAHAFGGVGWVNAVLLDYRRHGGNASGPATDNDSRGARLPHARAGRLWRGRGHQRQLLGSLIDQAAALRRLHGAWLDADLAWRLDRFLSVPHLPFPARIWTLARCRMRPPGPARLVAFALLTGGQGGAAPTSVTSLPEAPARAYRRDRRAFSLARQPAGAAAGARRAGASEA